MSNTNTEVLTTAYEKLQGAITQANTVLPELEEAVEKGNLDNYATTSDLEEKANKNDVGSPLTASSVTEMTDTSKVYVNTTDNNWYSWNGTNWIIGGVYQANGIAKKSITPAKTSFIETNNVIDFTNKVMNGLLSTTDGTIDATDTENKVTEKIDISDYVSKYIISSAPVMACFYTSDDTFISGLGNLNGVASRQVPANTKYIVIGITNSNYNNKLTADGGMIIEFFDTAQTDIVQVDYKKEENILNDVNIDFNNVNNFSLPNRCIENKAINKDSVRIDNVDFIVKDNNYIIFTDYLYDGVLDYTTGAITEGGGTEYYSSPIYVGDKQGKFITGCATIKVAFLNDNGIFISGLANLNGTSNRKIPNNAVYAVFGLTNQNYNYSISNYNKVGVQISDTALTTTLTTFDTFTDNKFKNVKIGYEDIINIPDGALDTDFYKYIFNKGICIGDSITEGYRESMIDKYKSMSYPYYLSKFLDCEVVNGGESGATAIRWWTTNFSKYNYADYNFAVIKLGQNAGLTDTLDTDVTGDDYTAYADTNTGDYCKIIEGIKTQNPNIKIYLVTIQSLDTNVNTTTNNVINKIATKYNLPVIDLDNQAINLRDSNKYHCGEDNAYFGVHFNTIGYMTLAKIISEDIKKHILNNYNNYKNLTF